MPIVDVFDEDTDRLARVFKITIISAVDFLLLECFHEALRLGVVVGITDPAHARLDIIGSKHGAVNHRKHTARRDRNDGSNAQPITLRLNASSSTAKNANSSN